MKDMFLPASIPALLCFLEHSDAVVVAQADRDGRIIACNLALMRLLHRDDRPIGLSIHEVFTSFHDTPLDFCAEEVNGSPLPQIAKHQGTVHLFKILCWHYDDGLVILAERIGGASDLVLQTMSSLTNELVNIGRDLAKKNRELQEAKDRIETLSRTDPLTGLANRRYFLERLDESMSLARRHNQPLCILMADLDHFKRVNDTFGHDAGDRVLQYFAGLLRDSCRKEDLSARMGGEEFLVLLPLTAENDALRLALRLGDAMRRSRVLDDGRPVTVSIGIARFRADDDRDSLLRRADQALYKAKAQGRDRVVVDNALVSAPEPTP